LRGDERRVGPLEKKVGDTPLLEGEKKREDKNTNGLLPSGRRKGGKVAIGHGH